MSNDVRVYRDHDGWAIWWELDGKYSGICIGSGPTREAAIADAMRRIASEQVGLLVALSTHGTVPESES
jgi:hypothetical protein